MRLLRQLNSANHASTLPSSANYTTPRIAGNTLCARQIFVYSLGRRANQTIYKRLGCDIYTLFCNLLARGILLAFITSKGYEREGLWAVFEMSPVESRGFHRPLRLPHSHSCPGSAR